MTQIKLHAWNRFICRSLAVPHSLLGAVHKWKTDEAEVEISIPTQNRIENDADSEDPIGKLTTWHVDGTALNYAIFQVDVRVCTNTIIDLDDQLLAVDAKAWDLIPENKRCELDSVAEKHGAIASQSFKYWLSILRWVSGNYRIGRYQVINNKSGWSTYLRESHSQKAIWSSPISMVVQFDRQITEQQWEKAQELLSKNLQVPIEVMYLHDAEEQYELGNLRRCVIDLCIAAETYMRQTVWSSFPTGLAANIRKEIQGMPIHKYREKFFKDLLKDAMLQQYDTEIKANLASLFKKRNTIMHKGQSNDVTPQDCKDYMKAVNGLLQLITV